MKSTIFQKRLAELKAAGLFRSLRTIDSPCESSVRIGNREYINLGSNNYLGLTRDPRVIKAMTSAARKYGSGSGSARLICGNNRLYRILEDRLADFKKTEKALLFSTGYMANLAIISTLLELDKESMVIPDRLCHASIIDGCRLSGARMLVYKHNDASHLSKVLQRKMANKLVVTEGIFSMDGDLACLPDIMTVSEKAGAMLMVDDAHATGILGENGRGSAEHFGVSPDIQMGTLGKALGSFGAYLAGSSDLIDYMINRARPFIFTTGLAPSNLAASIAALEILEKEPSHRQNLWENQSCFSSCLEQLGLAPGGAVRSFESPIMPIMVGDTKKAVKFADMLFDAGIYAPAIRPPTVPKGKARIRITVMATHSKEQLTYSLEKIAKISKKLDI